MSLFRAFVKSFVKNLGNYASGLLGVPIAGSILVNTWEYWERDSANEQQRKAELDVLARQSVEDALAEALEALRLEAPDLPEAQRQVLVGYLCQIPATIQRSLRRPEDRTGKSVPPGLALRSANDLMPFLPPTLPRFRQGDALPGRAGWLLDRQLGVGGFGEVWLARKTGYGSLVGAVKFCHILQTRDRDMLHESKVIDRLLAHGTHANIVRLLDVHLEGDAPWLMYEFVDGGDLADLIHQWSGLPMPQRQQKAIAALHELASAIGYFHRLEPAIIHRDLKPANILQDSSGRLRITDFGIGGVAARQLIESETRGSTTRAGRLQSCLYGSYTPLYASAQQRDGAEPDPRDDVHALGVIGYQMLTGHLDQGEGPDFVEDLQESRVEEALISLLRRCTAQKLERRPRDAGEVAEALDKMITERPAASALPKDDVQDVTWIRKAADQGDAVAQWQLGYDYEQGRGVPQDGMQAVSWYRKAADQGHVGAQYHLGWMYDNGVGVAQNAEQAASWYRKAATQGNAMAQFCLGWMYANGRGVPQDKVQAGVWYCKAAEQGNEDAKRILGWEVSESEKTNCT